MYDIQPNCVRIFFIDPRIRYLSDIWIIKDGAAIKQAISVLLYVKTLQERPFFEIG